MHHSNRHVGAFVQIKVAKWPWSVKYWCLPDVEPSLVKIVTSAEHSCEMV